jgi:hypothetical protein
MNKEVSIKTGENVSEKFFKEFVKVRFQEFLNTINGVTDLSEDIKFRNHYLIASVIEETLIEMDDARVEHLMDTNKEYRDRVSNVHFDKEHKLLLRVTVKNPNQATKLYESLFSKKENLVAGCLVTEVFVTDIIPMYNNILTDLNILHAKYASCRTFNQIS